ncbi:ABC transporter substrate-binding protein [Mitsuaria sp. WAJ17]|uniref:substrate-binding periplasmic protein n=1 Tax=Mitsuaria sp. WAJ17 TaxID=2761452 RepID=UPI0016003B4F|nr:hypothetical protein [Mitsuaria sp. WAJ17]
MGVLALGSITAGLAQAACSRPIQVPLAPVGLSVLLPPQGAATGVYPELLRQVGEAEGCLFVMNAVPRARQELMFESGRGDVLVPASRTSRRDEFGDFVPLIQARAMLISLRSDRPLPASLRALAQASDLRVALVRGFDYGDAYQGLLRELGRQGRLRLEVDPVSVARVLDAGGADLTLMAPSILVSALHSDERVSHLLGRLRLDAVEELGWNDSGIYLSRAALSEADRRHLQESLDKAARSGLVWKLFKQFYPAGSMEGSLRPKY